MISKNKVGKLIQLIRRNYSPGFTATAGGGGGGGGGGGRSSTFESSDKKKKNSQHYVMLEMYIVCSLFKVVFTYLRAYCLLLEMAKNIFKKSLD